MLCKRILTLTNTKANCNLIPVRWMVYRHIMHKDIIEAQRLSQFHEKELQEQEKIKDEDLPVKGIANPYAIPPQKCVLCEHKVELDYKNTRLLSQFVSPHTGQIYGRRTTGLCIYMQRYVSQLIITARRFGYMPHRNKHPQYLKDPQLFEQYK